MTTSTPTAPARRTKVCTRCGRKRSRGRFRVLVSGYLQGMCKDCERQYERERWHTRSDRSKQNSGQAATMRRRRQLAA